MLCNLGITSHHLLPCTLVLILAWTVVVSGRGVPGVFRKESVAEYKGLYAQSPYVTSMNGESLPSRIYNQPHATFLEFYNSYCGFCKRFAPHWTELSEEVKGWRDLVQIGALDCSRDENGDVCRQFDVMSYPTIRYIPPKYAAPTEGNKQIGHNVGSADHSQMKSLLVQLLFDETNPQPDWPNFQPLTNSRISAVLDEAPKGTVAGFVFVEDPSAEQNTTIAEIMLDFHDTKKISIRRALEPLPWMPSNLDGSSKPWLFVVTADTTSSNVLESGQSTKAVMTDKITVTLRKLQLVDGIVHAESEEKGPIVNPKEDNKQDGDPISDVMAAEQKKSIIEKVKTMKDAVFRADLDMALRYALLHEVTNYEDISGDRLTALKQFIATVARYFPFGLNGQRFIKDLQDYVMRHENSLSGQAYEEEVKRLEKTHSPVFSSHRWVGCASPREGMRGFTCSLWIMFHHLTVAADDQEKSTDPLEVLDAMHGYIKNFFGCTDCSKHFQEMAAKNKMWSVTSKDMAILWLWAAHNEVNERLSGDETEDPDFPKVQYPTKEICPKCYKTVSNGSGSAEWDKMEVLFFLKRIHSVQNISIFGVDNEMALPGVAARLSARSSSGLVNDQDFRLWLIVYLCSVALIIVAVKMFVKRRGCFYRKKLYVHDMLGKV